MVASFPLALLGVAVVLVAVMPWHHPHPNHLFSWACSPVSRLHLLPRRSQTTVRRPLRHSAIIFSSRTNGGCNQHGVGEDILG
jgi:hypothetical protein